VSFSSDGTGAALIKEVWYEVGIQDRPLVVEASYEEVNDLIKGAGLIEYKDYILWKVSPGAAIVPNIDRPLFECRMEIRRRAIAHLDVVIAYSGRMGDVWAKRIACIPRSQSSDVTPPPSATPQ
jgi:hypothetical protein